MANWGTFENPYAATSLWNSKPVNPVLGEFPLAMSYQPNMAKIVANKSYIDISAGPWSCGVYKAVATDAPRSIVKVPGSMGILDKDNDAYVDSITVPHWPSAAQGAPSSDGHCDVIDVSLGIIHSFWGYSEVNGESRCRQYAFAPLTGYGFGFGALCSIGARAIGVASSAGIIRTHEINDGKPNYEHALVCSLDYGSLAPNDAARGLKAYILPATSSDSDPETNFGEIPQGALLMLPASYDLSRLDRWPRLKKVAATLKIYGARVADRNTNCPMTIYVQRESGWAIKDTAGWDDAMQSELEYIRTQVRQVISVDRFIDGNGNTFAAPKRVNLLSMRGPWTAEGSTQNVKIFDSYNQRVNLPVEGGKWTDNGAGFKNENFKPQQGKYYKLYHETNCGAQLRMTFYKWDVALAKSVKMGATGDMGQYAERYIKWPLGGWCSREIAKLSNGKSGYSKWLFIEIDESEFNAGATKIF